GGLGEAVGRLWEWSLAKPTSRTRRVLYGLGGVVIGHGFSLVHGIVHYPQLYSEAFYDRGGARRRAMVFLTDHLTLTTIELILAAMLALAIVGPWLFGRGREQARRAIRAARRRPSWMAAAALGILAGLAIAAASSRSRAGAS